MESTGSGSEEATKIGALVPLTRPGWVEAGRHLLAGLQLAVSEINGAGGVGGKALELLVRDTAADPQKAVAAVDDLARLGVVAIAGEYHSVVARAAAIRADELGLPFLCSSAVLDRLTEQPTKWVARLAPPQSRGWQIYADFLSRTGHDRIAVASQQSIYWASGVHILRDRLKANGATLSDISMSSLDPSMLCDQLIDRRATVLLLLVGQPEPAISIVKSVRNDGRLSTLKIGAPAGQPEFAEWATLLGEDSAAIPFLRYRPGHLNPLGSRVERALWEKLGEAPSFVALEGYDTIVVLAQAIRSFGTDRNSIAESWPHIEVAGTRGHIQFFRTPATTAWQWTDAPIQIAERTPGNPAQFRHVLDSG
ncbi:ABC transporter substrate-binding protein [Mesorhizobium australicum]|uniref:ABC transporter substrate-binding protein n=1 Tax=Mesorhizobium australicum TaxID=536018 RepID=UPI00333D6DAD